MLLKALFAFSPKEGWGEAAIQGEFGPNYVLSTNQVHENKDIFNL